MVHSSWQQGYASDSMSVCFLSRYSESCEWISTKFYTDVWSLKNKNECSRGSKPVIFWCFTPEIFTAIMLFRSDSSIPVLFGCGSVWNENVVEILHNFFSMLNTFVKNIFVVFPQACCHRPWCMG